MKTFKMLLVDIAIVTIYGTLVYNTLSIISG
jgi:hypothetical protein